MFCGVGGVGGVGGVDGFCGVGAAGHLNKSVYLQILDHKSAGDLVIRVDPYLVMYFSSNPNRA